MFLFISWFFEIMITLKLIDTIFWSGILCKIFHQDHFSHQWRWWFLSQIFRRLVKNQSD